MPLDNAQQDITQKNATPSQLSGIPRLFSEMARLGALGVSVGTTAIIPEYLIDRANHSALQKSRGHALPTANYSFVNAAATATAGMKGNGFMSLALKSAQTIFSPLPAKIVASSNKNGVRRTTEIAKENMPQEKQTASIEEQSSTHHDTTTQPRQVHWRENMLWGSMIFQFGFAETFITGRTALYAAHKTEVANFNPSFKVVEAPSGWRVEDLKKRLHYRSTGTLSRTIKNSSQIFMYPVCAYMKGKLLSHGADNYTASFGASAFTSVIFSPCLSVLGFVYREQAISLNPETCKSISTVQAMKKIPLEFIKDSFWSRTTANNALFAITMLLMVNGYEELIDKHFMPSVNKKIHENKDFFVKGQKRLGLFKPAKDIKKMENLENIQESSSLAAGTKRNNP